MGMFDAYQSFWTYSHRKSDDKLLRFHDNCPNYQKVKDQSSIEGDKFLAKYLPIIKLKIQEKLGDHGNNWVTETLVDQMHHACIFDIALENRSDHFCTLFDREDMEILEYADDLKEFYRKANGFEINYRMSCLLITEMINIFELKINGNRKIKHELAKLRFAHGETVIPVLSALGLYKPNNNSEMSSDSTPQQIRNRVWKSSIANPFGSNIALILYNCSNVFKVKILHNEAPVIINGCNDIYCPFEVLKHQLRDYINCSFDNICGKPVEQFCATETQTPIAFELMDIIIASIVSFFFWHAFVLKIISAFFLKLNKNV